MKILGAVLELLAKQHCQCQLSKFPEILSSVYNAIYEYPCTYMLAFNIAGVAGVANRQTGRRISFTGGLCL